MIWPATRSAQRETTRLIHTRSDVTAHQLFAVNVALDDFWEHRRSTLAAAIEEIGGLEPCSSPHASPERPSPERLSSERTLPGEESLAPSHLVWHLPGRAGRLRVEIQLNPESPPRVQTLKITPN